MSALPELTRWDTDAFGALDGKRVRALGLYLVTVLSKRPGFKAPPPDLTQPGLAAVELEDTSLMLGIYYEASGFRAAEELQRFHGKRVVVTGTFHEHTPTLFSDDGYELQTMIGAYVGEIESIELID